MSSAPGTAGHPSAPRVALNPLAWILGPTGVQPLAGDRLLQVLREIRTAGFDAVMAEVPDELEVDEYQALLAELGLQPAPGYFAAPFERTSAVPEILHRARRCAREHAVLGLTEVFVAGDMVASRKARPAMGSGWDRGTLTAFAQNLARVADAMATEGVRACLHPHVGTLVETENETRFVLDTTDPDLVRFGPDTGHLFWAGVDPAALIADYAPRVGGVHLKDVHQGIALGSMADGASYDDATLVRHLWTEPGQGDVDLPGVLKALPDFTGWWVVEVDVPDRKTPEQSAAISAAWAADHISDGGAFR